MTEGRSTSQGRYTRSVGPILRGGGSGSHFSTVKEFGRPRVFRRGPSEWPCLEGSS